MEEHIELGSLGLGTLPPVDEYLKRNYKTINNNFSKTLNAIVHQIIAHIVMR